jgi:hypothetical protein
VTVFKGKPQVAVSRKEQIKIMKDEGTPPLRPGVTAARTKEPAVAVTNAKPNNNKSPEAGPVAGTIEVQPAIRLEKVNMSGAYSETLASFPGGERELVNFLAARLRCPTAAKTGNKQSVMASYMIEMDGSISNIQIRESSGKIYSEEVVRVLSEMPKWKPRFRNGYTVLDRLYQTFIFNCTVAK